MSWDRLPEELKSLCDQLRRLEIETCGTRAGHLGSLPRRPARGMVRSHARASVSYAVLTGDTRRVSLPAPRSPTSPASWLRSTHHGVEPKHLQAYLDEFAFRFNRRRTPMAAFQSLLRLTGAHEPTTYKMLYVSESTG